MIVTQRNYTQDMGEHINLDIDYQHLDGFGGLLPIVADLSPDGGTGGDVAAYKAEHQLTLLNISGSKPELSGVNAALNANNNSFSRNTIQTNPQNIDHLLKIIENQEKQNERMLIQFRLKQVLLDYLKTRSCPQSTCAGNTATSSPSLCQQQNHCIQALETDNQRIPILSESKNSVLSGYSIGGQSPTLLTPPISPDIGPQYYSTNDSTTKEQKTSNISFIGLNSTQEVIESQELSESIEKFYSSESEEQHNNYMAIEEEDEDFNNNNNNNNNNRSLFDENFDYPLQSSSYLNSMTSSSNCSKFNTSAIQLSEVKTNTDKSDNSGKIIVKTSNRGRKHSSVSAPGESSTQMQKRSAHLSAEFRYRTKLNDKITKLRNIVGPKSQLSKSGVLSRSIDLISKLQKSNTKLRDENKKIRILLMQACNGMSNSGNQNNALV